MLTVVGELVRVLPLLSVTVHVIEVVMGVGDTELLNGFGAGSVCVRLTVAVLVVPFVIAMPLALPKNDHEYVYGAVPPDGVARYCGAFVQVEPVV
jgi:hypothetical protein